MARDWQSLVSQMPQVCQLVHLAMRKDTVDEDAERAELLRIRRKAYDEELTIQAARVGCPGRVGRLAEGPFLSQLNDASKADAASIINTYNYDLALAINAIRVQFPRANRYTYAAKLRGWEAARSAYKSPQIIQHATQTARAQALQDFYANNTGIFGVAYIEPTQAVCPVCQGWIKRGGVPVQIATNNPPPYHVGCPHYWRTVLDKVAPDQCPLLWMGA